MKQKDSDRRIMSAHHEQLEITIHDGAAAETADDAINIEATLLDLDDGAFARLTSAAWCGTPGCSGFDDQWGRRLSCPGYGRA